MTNKSQAILELLDPLTKPIGLDALHRAMEKKLGGILSKKKLRDLLYNMTSHGYVITHGHANTATFELNRNRSASKAKPARKLPRHNFGLSDIAERIAARKTLTHRHALSTFAALTAALDLGRANPTVIATVQAHREALELLPSVAD